MAAFSFLQGETPDSRSSWHLAFAIAHFFNMAPAALLSDWRKMTFTEKCEMKECLEREGYKIVDIVDDLHPNAVIEGTAIRLPDKSNLPVAYGGPLLSLLPPKDKAGPNYQQDDEPEYPRVIVDGGYKVGDVHPAAEAV